MTQPPKVIYSAFVFLKITSRTFYFDNLSIKIIQHDKIFQLETIKTAHGKPLRSTFKAEQQKRSHSAE